MSSTRLEQLQKFFDEDPRDPFNIYGLALEYTKHDPVKARELFDLLLQEHPEYIPTYFHAAKLYVVLDHKEKAMEVYRKGIDISSRLNDQKARRELTSAYQELIFDLDS